MCSLFRVWATLQMYEAKLQTNCDFYLSILHNNSVIQSFNICEIIAEEYMLKEQSKILLTKDQKIYVKVTN